MNGEGSVVKRVMRLKAEDKRRITERVRKAAAVRFRKTGVDAVSLDALMQDAGLTRGAFYAHYASKEALLLDVARHEHPLLTMLEAREGEGREALREGMLSLFAGYLAPENLTTVFEGCSLAALGGDVERASDAVKAAYGEAVGDILTEMARGQAPEPAAYAPALTLASGAVRTAQALSAPEDRAMILNGAHRAFVHLIEAAEAEART